MRLADFFAATGGPPRPLPDMRRLPPDVRRMLIAALALAVVWWLAAVIIDQVGGITIVWNDQRATFRQLPFHLSAPYALPAFRNPPWAALAQVPFVWIPLPLSMLVQMILYFGVLALIVYRFGGGLGAVLVGLSSFFALLASVEFNVEWLASLGLLLPAALSGPFLLIKPQIALGAYLGYSPRQLVRAAVGAALVGVVSLLIWDWWPPLMLGNPEATVAQRHNMAPVALLGWYIALPIAAGLAWFAIRRRDPVLGIFAGLFVVPYIAPYSLLLAFTLLAVRRRRLAALISAVMWVIYGGALVLGLLLMP
ncbi:MAG: hypothetical protein IT323_21745 [Anaerolineae bacterium]|nr:hypothetical protein [Anaerolineae bacterium]